MRLIDADALADASCSGGVCAECDDMHGGNNVVANCSEVRFHFLKLIKDAPTIEERKKGKWNTYCHGDIDFSHSCNQCGYSAPYQMIGGEFFQKKWNFCPSCGADMRKAKFDEKGGQT